MDTFTQAIKFLDIGIGLLPIKFMDKKPDSFHLLNGSWDVFKTTLPTHDQVKNWFNAPHNYGVITGWHDLVVIDFDDMDVYRDWLTWAMDTGRTARMVAESAYKVTTSRGVHVYVRLSQLKARKLDRIDIKAAGGYVLGPGSIHPSGRAYTALHEVFNFPFVESLGDVLPAALLQQHTELKSAKLPQALNTAPTSVWDVLDSGGKVGHGTVEKIKRQLRVEDYFPSKSQTSATGRYFLAECPFHDDRSPSFWLDTQKQICNCFVCQFEKPLDVIDLHARLYGISNTEAIRSIGGAL